MRLSFGPLVPLLLAAVVLVAMIDGGSVMMTRLKTPDQVQAAGRAAAAAVEDRPVDQQAARTAFEVASQQARPAGLTVEEESFTLYPDGRVSLVGTRTAPTLVLERIDALRHLAEVTSSATVSASPYS